MPRDSVAEPESHIRGLKKKMGTTTDNFMLDSADVLLIKTLLDNPASSLRAISRRLKTTPSWTSRRVTELTDRGVIERVLQLRPETIGLHVFYVLLTPTDPYREEDIFERLADSPILHSATRLLTSYWQLLATMLIPRVTGYMDVMNRFSKKKEKWGVKTCCIESGSYGISYTLDYYEPNIGEWTIPWELLDPLLLRIHNDHLGLVVPRVDKCAELVETKVDRKDLKILSLVRPDGIGSFIIRQSAGDASESALSRLVQTGVLEPVYRLRGMGLQERLLVYVYSEEARLSISAWSSRLPTVQMAFGSLGDALFEISLPTGGAYSISKALSALGLDISVAVPVDHVTRPCPLPFELWDETTQSWTGIDTRVYKWLDCLR